MILPVAAVLLCSALLPQHVQGLPTWDCQLKGGCTYYHANPTTLGCNSQPPECVPASASQQCGAQNVNIRGEVLTLDVNSMNYSGGPNKPPAVTTARECCEACRKQQGCNAWTFCWKLEGCGSGCIVTNKLPEQRDPTKELGQYGSCGEGGKYPFRMCSLKRVPDPANPPLWDGGMDWTSGAVA